MPGSALWFVLVAATLPVAWFAGRACGRMRSRVHRGCAIGLAFTLIILWSLLIRNPAWAVQVIPVAALARLEGVGAAPLFIFMLGAGWHLALLKRQRAVMVMGMCLGTTYFVQGGMWMMHPTPSNAFGRDHRTLIIEQSQDYSCVPAASATALRLLGVHATEDEMAHLTETRSGTGATLLRALNGLDARLKHTGIEAELLEMDYDGLLHIEPPMLTPLQYESARLHMVNLVEVRPHLVLVADPQVGVEFVPRRRFEQLYRGQVIAFDGPAKRATTQDVLRQNWYAIDPDVPDSSTQAKR